MKTGSATKTRTEKSNRTQQGCRGDGNCTACRLAPQCDIAKRRRMKAGGGARPMMRKK